MYSLLAPILLFLIDAPFIYMIGDTYKKLLGRKDLTTWKRAIPAFLGVYFVLTLAIIYVILPSESPLISAFLIGMAAYGTYGFTVYAIQPNWPEWLVVVETLWGGILLFLTTYFLTC